MYCRTSSVADALAMSVRSGPRVLSLQRCFGLGPAAAGNLLVAAGAADGFRLKTLLLSHLDRLDLPRDPPALETLEDGAEKETLENVELVKSIVSRVPGTGLRILALHNCGNLGPFELAAIVSLTSTFFNYYSYQKLEAYREAYRVLAEQIITENIENLFLASKFPEDIILNQFDQTSCLRFELLSLLKSLTLLIYMYRLKHAHVWRFGCLEAQPKD